MYTFTKKEKYLPVNLKPQTPHDTHTHTQKKLLVKSKTTPMPTHAHTQLYTYQISKTGKADQSKHTPGKRNNDPYINQFDQPIVI